MPLQVGSVILQHTNKGINTKTLSNFDVCIESTMFIRYALLSLQPCKLLNNFIIGYGICPHPCLSKNN